MGTMAELSPRTPPSTRKVRFKIASSYSGRVLKHVYEDGQELDSPAEKYPHSFLHGKIPTSPTHLEMEELYGLQGHPDSGHYPPTGLIAQRINVYRGFRPPAYGDLSGEDSKSPVLDFGKIIIYTSNLRIVRSPQRMAEVTGGTSFQGGEVGGEFVHRQVTGGRRSRRRALCAHVKDKLQHDSHQEDASCPQCGGSGCAPCSLCHGSKLSMLANRFNESIRALRCPACYPDGRQQCQSCAH